MPSVLFVLFGNATSVASMAPNPKSNNGKNQLALFCLLFSALCSLFIRFVCVGRKKQSKSNAIRTVCVNFVSYRLFGGGRGRVCLNSRSRRPPPNRRYDTKFTQTVLMALLLLCFFYQHKQI